MGWGWWRGLSTGGFYMSYAGRMVWITAALGIVLAMPPGAPAADTSGEAPKIPVEQIIKKFVDKETEFSLARENYTYRQSVKITEYDEVGNARGKWELVQDVIFSADNKRTERVVYAPVSTLSRIILTPKDMEDLRSVQPFVMTNADVDKYQIDYLGTEKIDEIDCYVFSVKPKKMEQNERYFEGQIWVDQIDLQIVKTYGKGVGLLKKNADDQFPRFETYRQQIDGKYWFPTYTRADDVLHFKTGDQHIRMVIRYDDYKQFKSQTDIQFGGIVDDTTGAVTKDKPTGPPQAPQPQRP
jgi:Outer membrane lipoprotein-sorting protein